MAGVGTRAAVLTLSRLASYGLMLIGPIIAARLLTVHDFGRYREFVLYGSILAQFGAFYVRDSLLYFIPAHPQSPWRVVRQTAWLTAAASVLTCVLLYVADRLSGGALVGEYLTALIPYTLFVVNLDFWEYFWIARHRPAAVFIYSASRLLARVLVVTIAAIMTHDVNTIIWALVALEGVRFLASVIVMWLLDKSRHEPPVHFLRDQLRFCLPSGAASLLSVGSRNLSNVVVAKVLGVVALGQFSIGRFSEPIVLAARTSLSAVILPEMVRRDRQSSGPSLALWKQATVVNIIFIVPVAVFVARYAESIVAVLFGENYRAAGLIMQLYMFVVIRECFDFAPALRALNRNHPLVVSNFVAFVTCGAALAVLIPLAGLPGAMIAFVLGSFADATYLCWRVCKLYKLPVRDVLPWAALIRTGVAAAVAALVLISDLWTETFGTIVGIGLAGLLYLSVFAVVLLWLRVPEAELLLNWTLRLLRRKGASCST
jgi:O-antigen/teichoic acid export membrane protein